MDYKKQFLHKLLLDPLPMIDYFIPEEDLDFVIDILGEEGVRWMISHHTLFKPYADEISSKIGVEHNLEFKDIDSEDISKLLSMPISDTGREFLKARGWKDELYDKYQLSSWKWYPHKLDSIRQFIPFNLEALLVTSKMLAKWEWPILLTEEEQLVFPSYDRNHHLNNIALRHLSPDISRIAAKWWFSHGRQATFGLERVDPSKPVYIVEGWFDWVACEEMGIQSVGLGSAFISDAHYRYLDGLDLIFLLDSDDVGRKYSERLEEEGCKVHYLSSEYKDPWEFYINGKSCL